MEPEDMQDETPEPQKTSKGYGKRSKGQWILIYVIAAIIIYGLIYLLFIRKTGPGSSGGY